jgi:hypothetical protein
MRLGSQLRSVLIAGGVFVLLGIFGVAGLRLVISRAGEFRVQAQAGQPIVRAIEEFRKQTGSYPPSLSDLAPKYLLGGGPRSARQVAAQV